MCPNMHGAACMHGLCGLHAWMVRPACMDGAACMHGWCGLHAWMVRPACMDGSPEYSPEIGMHHHHPSKQVGQNTVKRLAEDCALLTTSI